MLEPAAALIEPIETGSQAAEPEITAGVLENGIELTAFAETAAARAGNDNG